MLRRRHLPLLVLLLLSVAVSAQDSVSPFSSTFLEQMARLERQGARRSRTKITSDSLFRRFAQPPMEVRPFVRWWWNGDKVEPDEIRRELQQLHEAGIGGVEVNPIEFPRRCDSVGKPSLTWLSEEWMEALRVAAEEARRLQMQCDLLVGSGWPFGSEMLPLEDRAQVLLTYAIPLEGTAPVTLLIEDIYKSVDPQVTTPNPLRTFELVSLTLAPDSITDLSQVREVTPRHMADTLHIYPPEGKSVLYCLVRCRSFASVINGAPGAAGSILDHLNAAAVQRYLQQMSTALESRLGPAKNYLRGYFVDSMELEGCNWTDDFAAEFKSRRGYDLLPYMPLISFQVGRLGEVRSYHYGAKKSPAIQRQLAQVRRDYEITKAELFFERYTLPFVAWCDSQQVESRAQAYGRGFFPYESSMAFSIPEGESWTTNYLRHRVGEEMPDEDYRRGRAYTMINKYVSSAAHVMGRREVSAEEMTNTYRVFHTSLELLKLGSDMSAISGTTHSVWHGYNYSPPEAGFPGWVQYGSYYNEQNPWWPYFRQLNDYRARTSVLLQQGELQSRVALLLPTEQLWGECGVQTEPFPNYPKGSIYEVPQLLWEAVHKCGGNCDLVSRSLVEVASYKGGKLHCGARSYEMLLVMEDDSLALGSPLVTRMAKEGKVLKVPNLGDRNYLDWYAEQQRQKNLPHDVEMARPDRFLLQNHYRLDDGSDMYYLVNAHIDQPLEDTLMFPREVWRHRTCWLYDATTGARYRLPIDEGRLSVRLGPAESWLVVFNREKKGEDYRPLRITAERKQGLDTCWTVVLKHSVTGQCDTLYNQRLRDFKEDSLYGNFMGTITYSTTLNIHNNTRSKRPMLDLGKVCDIAEVWVNGEPCGVRWYGDRVFDLTGHIHFGINQVEVRVTTLMGNYMRTLEENKVVQNFVINRKVPRVSLGLLGPVRIQY